MTEAEAGLLGLPTQDPTSSLIQLLNLGELEGARTDEDIFMGPSQQQPKQRVFGGVRAKDVPIKPVRAKRRIAGDVKETAAITGPFDT